MDKVLLIDDDETIRNYLKVVFENRGFKVFLAKDGMAGVQRAANERPDLIVLDNPVDNVRFGS